MTSIHHRTKQYFETSSAKPCAPLEKENLTRFQFNKKLWKKKLRVITNVAMNTAHSKDIFFSLANQCRESTSP